MRNDMMMEGRMGGHRTFDRGEGFGPSGEGRFEGVRGGMRPRRHHADFAPGGHGGPGGHGFGPGGHGGPDFGPGGPGGRGFGPGHPGMPCLPGPQWRRGMQRGLSNPSKPRGMPPR